MPSPQSNSSRSPPRRTSSARRRAARGRRAARRCRGRRGRGPLPAIVLTARRAPRRPRRRPRPWGSHAETLGCLSGGRPDANDALPAASCPGQRETGQNRREDMNARTDTSRANAHTGRTGGGRARRAPSAQRSAGASASRAEPAAVAVHARYGCRRPRSSSAAARDRLARWSGRTPTPRREGLRAGDGRSGSPAPRVASCHSRAQPHRRRHDHWARAQGRSSRSPGWIVASEMWFACWIRQIASRTSPP